MTTDSNEYAWSFNEEVYYGQEPSIEAAIEEAIAEAEDGEHEVFWIGKCKRFKAMVNVHGIIEELQDQCWDECGEFGETYLESVTQAECEELSNLISDWIARVDRSNFYTIEGAQKFTLDEARAYIAKTTESAQ